MLLTDVLTPSSEDEVSDDNSGSPQVKAYLKQASTKSLLGGA